MDKLKTLIFFMLLFSISLGSLQAVEIKGLGVFGGITWLGNMSDEGGPDPLLKPIGGEMIIMFTPLFSISPALSVFSTQYQLTADGQKAVPTEVEFANSTWVLAALLDVMADFEFHINDEFSLGAMAFPSFLFRIPLTSWGTAVDTKGDMTSYFYGNLRFLYLGAGGFLRWEMMDGVALSIRLFTRLPIFHIWDGESVPFTDQMMIGGTAGFIFYL